ncbi:prepilin-type N-terminal cleavage/methylation domain-containing protein [Candidatus Dependentiae bacterium]|nr:prepilin-type N-terminal cleavage/methylation domain-containing protein [Candidatus Dependentiae bacterium]
MKKGFTLLEVLLSLLILVSAVTIFSSTQLRSVLRIFKEKEFLDRAFIVEQELINFIEIQDEKSKRLEKKEIENPEMKIVLQKMDIDKKSSLRSFMNNIKIVKSEATWNYFGANYKLPFVTFMETKEKEAG